MENTNSPNGILRLSLKIRPKKTVYAQLPFPESYAVSWVLLHAIRIRRWILTQWKAAQAAALELFSEHLQDIAADQLVLKGLAKNKHGKWVGNLIRPKDWATMGPTFCEFKVVPPNGAS